MKAIREGLRALRSFRRRWLDMLKAELRMLKKMKYVALYECGHTVHFFYSDKHPSRCPRCGMKLKAVMPASVYHAY